MILPNKAFTAFSIIGVNCLHGEHHGAQKSTITGSSSEALITFSTKFSVSYFDDVICHIYFF